jgi:hypothetical protein
MGHFSVDVNIKTEGLRLAPALPRTCQTVFLCSGAQLRPIQRFSEGT